VLSKLPRAYGIALIEDGSHQLSRIETLRGVEFHDREPSLLAVARQWMPAIPLPEVDVLVLDEIGKNISGAGMDTNIVGRGVDTLPMPNRRSIVRRIYVRGLTPESRGNAIGIGLADVVSSRLVEQMDPVSTYTNAISAMTPATARVSIHFKTDAECLRAVLRVAAADPARPRIVRIRHTLALDRIVSQACLETLSPRAVLVPPTSGASTRRETSTQRRTPCAGSRRGCGTTSCSSLLLVNPLVHSHSFCISHSHVNTRVRPLTPFHDAVAAPRGRVALVSGAASGWASARLPRRAPTSWQHAAPTSSIATDGGAREAGARRRSRSSGRARRPTCSSRGTVKELSGLDILVNGAGINLRSRSCRSRGLRGPDAHQPRGADVHRRRPVR
jgi:hypothetical protein